MAIKREKDNYTIQSVSHALDILESFTKNEDELGVTGLSKRLGLHKNNVFRLLATLEHRGYIEQNHATENYRLGPKTLQLGSIFIEQRECRRQARPILEALMASSGETAVWRSCAAIKWSIWTAWRPTGPCVPCRAWAPCCRPTARLWERSSLPSLQQRMWSSCTRRTNCLPSLRKRSRAGLSWLLS